MRKRRRKKRSGILSSGRRYPPLPERERIIQLRELLSRELIEIMFYPEEQEERIGQLIAEYGVTEVSRTMEIVQESFASRDLITEEAGIYRRYRHAYARFGGHHPFLSRIEYEAKMDSYTPLSMRSELLGLGPLPPSQQEKELAALLLIGSHFWEDITPPAVPRRPAGWEAPSPDRYGVSTRALLKWGLDLTPKQLKQAARRAGDWLPAAPELVRMALDPGLLEGWPAVSASWAPYHALSLLALLPLTSNSPFDDEILQGWAGQLHSLVDRENDWLSDLVPPVIGQMGSSALPPLWDWLGDASRTDDRRALALLGLQAIADNFPDSSDEIVTSLIEYVNGAPVAEATLTAYTVYVLDEMGVEDATDAIRRAFDEGRVNTRIVAPESLQTLGEKEPWR
jgi:hypothetical protein